MKDISLKDLLEAGCHFGHKTQKWHPKASSFIYQEREGIHIIDLAKTRDGLNKAADFVKELGRQGKIVLFVATKRQARGVVTEAAKRAKLPYLTDRWIGGFLTNWSEVEKNIEKVNKLRQEKKDGSWEKFPKHERIKLEKSLRKLEKAYGGVVDLVSLPEVVFIVDIRKEETCLREAIRLTIPTIAIVDTNTDPRQVSFPIPANDDAVGSISYIANYLSVAYIEGQKMGEKEVEKEKKKEEIKEKKEKSKEEEQKETEEKNKEGETEAKFSEKKEEVKKPKKRGRPKNLLLK